MARLANGFGARSSVKYDLGIRRIKDTTRIILARLVCMPAGFSIFTPPTIASVCVCVRESDGWEGNRAISRCICVFVCVCVNHSAILGSARWLMMIASLLSRSSRIVLAVARIYVYCKRRDAQRVCDQRCGTNSQSKCGRRRRTFLWERWKGALLHNDFTQTIFRRQ